MVIDDHCKSWLPDNYCSSGFCWVCRWFRRWFRRRRELYILGQQLAPPPSSELVSASSAENFVWWFWVCYRTVLAESWNYKIKDNQIYHCCKLFSAHRFNLPLFRSCVSFKCRESWQSPLFEELSTIDQPRMLSDGDINIECRDLREKLCKHSLMTRKNWQIQSLVDAKATSQNWG